MKQKITPIPDTAILGLILSFLGIFLMTLILEPLALIFISIGAFSSKNPKSKKLVFVIFFTILFIVIGVVKNLIVL